MVLAIGVPCSASASVDSRQFRFFHPDGGDGLSQSSVTAIPQDSKGFVWLGTLNGLLRIGVDGSRKVFRLPASQPNANLKNAFSSISSIDVRATDKSGNWSAHELSLPINIVPPWWLTWQAKVAFVLSFCVVIYLGYRVRSWQIHVYAKRLEREVEDRTHLLREYNQQLKITARTDYLTGLPNRRYFLEEAERHYASFLRTQRKFSVLLMDVDHFKSINDQWGHEGGDYVLVELASRLCSTCRQMDLIARWGGEEFIMLFPESDIHGCLAAVEKVKRSIIARPFHYKGNHFYITVTIGVAEVSAGVALEQSINDADKALYRGKKSGRNCIRYALQ